MELVWRRSCTVHSMVTMENATDPWSHVLHKQWKKYLFPAEPKPDVCKLWYLSWVAEPFLKWGKGARQKDWRIAKGFNWQLWRHKHWNMTYTPYEGINYTILDKITSLWKRIGEPPETQIGCYRGNPGHQRHSQSIYSDWLNKSVRRLRHWNFHLLSFWMALSLPCLWR